MVLIEQVEINDSLKKDIQKEFEKYEAKDGVSFNHTPFCFGAKENGKVIGAITGFRCFSEIYIDELIVFEHQRGKQIGTQLIQMVEDTYKNQNLHNINLCTCLLYTSQAAAEQFLGSGAWHVDEEGVLEQEDGYYVYTIKPGDIQDGVATVRFDPIASPYVLIEDNYHPGSNTGVKVKLINESGKKLVWESGGYDFTTVNNYQVGGPIPVDIDQYTGFESVDYGTEDHEYLLQYGTAYQTNPNSFDVKDVYKRQR